MDPFEFRSDECVPRHGQVTGSAVPVGSLSSGALRGEDSVSVGDYRLRTVGALTLCVRRHLFFAGRRCPLHTRTPVVGSNQRAFLVQQMLRSGSSG